MIFYNLTDKNMSFQNVFSKIKTFISQEPSAQYRLIIGTDSQVHARSTKFITGVVIRREGNGAWACLKKHEIRKRTHDLYKKISIETKLTEEVAQLFSAEKKIELMNLILPYVKEGSSLTIEGHIDIGKGERNKTKIYVEEMVNRIEELGMKPFVKPDSFVASSYANRYTK
ncbi:ribonuclease H-like YkuK family protein [Bacillus sp. FJAT-45350]|uniref:ribonuclease H-like YkuK family protein n=1 Tax=Bacillus sp. FJAT-45350 TaxID=2011014 RepID=UPI000BB6E912|nr:ribonuclease H-like YkuK family protein [Bacillus sp. FJAT-45350]